MHVSISLNSIGLVGRIIAISLVLAMLISCTPPLSPSESAMDWRQARLDKLTAPDGWLSLTALAWINDGEQTLGSSADSDIVLSSGPARLGTLSKSGDQFELQVSEGSRVKVAGQRGPRYRLTPDDAGDATVVAVDTLQFYVVNRGEYALRVKDADAKTRVEFSGLDYFPFAGAWYLEAQFESYDPSREIQIANVLGQVEQMINPGALSFRHEGVDYRVEVVDETGDEEELFLIFGDRTNGKQTYGAGRFVYAPWPKDGKTTLDFNRSYNPPCVFTEFSTCPLPPRGNRLNVAILAGEKMYQGAAGHDGSKFR